MMMRALSPWLLISVGLHLALLAVLAMVRFVVPDTSAEQMITLNMVEVTEIAKPAPVEPELVAHEPIVVNSPPKAVPPEPVPRRNTAVLVKPGVPKPVQQHGVARTETSNVRTGTGTGPTAPPKLLTSANGPMVAPPGKDGGIGTKGEDLGPSGPSYGAAAKGGRTPSYPKLAQEQNLSGTVTIVVTVAPDGDIAGLDVDSSGHAILDDAAKRAARSWTFTPAMEKGVATTGVVRLRFRFADGSVEGQVL